MKISKDNSKKHQQALDLLRKDILTYDDKMFVIENYNEAAQNLVSNTGAFFTPPSLAKDFVIETISAPTIDLCAGIGILAFHAFHHNDVTDITCIEINPEYLAIGKKLLPEAKWILGSVLDSNLISSLPHFKQVISNPPFGNIKTSSDINLKYTGSNFEFKVVEIASRVAQHGVFILPQTSTPFLYSGSHSMQSFNSKLYDKFLQQTGISFDFNCGLDTSVHKTLWKATTPNVEIITCDFTNIHS